MTVTETTPLNLGPTQYAPAPQAYAPHQPVVQPVVQSNQTPRYLGEAGGRRPQGGAGGGRPQGGGSQSQSPQWYNAEKGISGHVSGVDKHAAHKVELRKWKKKLVQVEAVEAQWQSGKLMVTSTQMHEITTKQQIVNRIADLTAIIST